MSPFTGRCLNPGDDGSGCEYSKATYDVGAMVPVLGCRDRCSCTAPGKISCPPCACVPCTLTQDYTFSIGEGKFGALYRPGKTLLLTRPIPGTDVGASCFTALPVCDTAKLIDTSDLYADLADADVEKAFTTSPAPTYGDSAATADRFVITRSGSGSFSVVVGFDCQTRTFTCEPIPPGVRRLADDVLAVVSRAIADRSCTNCCTGFW